jgi:predicted chitinase
MASAANAKKHLQGINEACSTFGIQTYLRKGHFLAQVLHESINLAATAERKVPPTKYGGYKGRGLMQLTYKDAYSSYGRFVKEDFVSTEKAKQTLETAPPAGKSAGWVWSRFKQLNDEADENDFILITQSINGGFNGHDDRLKKLNTIANLQRKPF